MLRICLKLKGSGSAKGVYTIGVHKFIRKKYMTVHGNVHQTKLLEESSAIKRFISVHFSI